VGQQSISDLGLLIVEVPRSHSYPPPGKTPLNERSTRRTDRYLHKTQQKLSISSAGFESAFPVIERAHTFALGLTATGIGQFAICY